MVTFLIVLLVLGELAAVMIVLYFLLKYADMFLGWAYFKLGFFLLSLVDKASIKEKTRWRDKYNELK